MDIQQLIEELERIKALHGARVPIRIENYGSLVDRVIYEKGKVVIQTF